MEKEVLFYTLDNLVTCVNDCKNILGACNVFFEIVIMD